MLILPTLKLPFCTSTYTTRIGLVYIQSETHHSLLLDLPSSAACAAVRSAGRQLTCSRRRHIFFFKEGCFFVNCSPPHPSRSHHRVPREQLVGDSCELGWAQSCRSECHSSVWRGFPPERGSGRIKRRGATTGLM